jgi:hypothetical protein
VQDYEYFRVLRAQADLSNALNKLGGGKLVSPGWINVLVQLELNLDYYRSTVEQLSNYGFLGRPTWSTNAINWDAPFSAQTETNANGWLTIEAVMTDPKALRHHR